MKQKKPQILILFTFFLLIFVSCSTLPADADNSSIDGMKIADTPSSSPDNTTFHNSGTTGTEVTPSASTPTVTTPSATPSPSPPQKNMTVALTFDDGPHASFTPALLDALKERDVKATFFMLGLMAEKSPSLVKRIADEGHSIGNHSYSHMSFAKMTKSQVIDEINKTDNIIKNACGKKPSFLRTPYGDISPTIKESASTPIVLWNVDPEDWKHKDAEIIKNNVVSAVKDNCIILMHDIYQRSVDAAILIIDELKAQGVRFVTVEELLSSSYGNLKNGGVYFSG